MPAQSMPGTRPYPCTMALLLDVLSAFTLYTHRDSRDVFPAGIAVIGMSVNTFRTQTSCLFVRCCLSFLYL